MTGTGPERRMDAVPRAVRALHSRPHPHVCDAAPEGVQQDTEQENTELARHVDAQEGVDILAIAKQSQQSTDKLRAAGADRVLLPKPGWPHIDQPRWSSEVHRVQSVRGGYDTDTIEKRTQLRFALPVPATSADVEPQRALRDGNTVRNTARRQALEPYIRALIAHFEVVGRHASLQEAGEFLATILGDTDMVRRLSLHAEGLRAVAALLDDLRLVGVVLRHGWKCGGGNGMCPVEAGILELMANCLRTVETPAMVPRTGPHRALRFKSNAVCDCVCALQRPQSGRGWHCGTNGEAYPS